MARKYKPLVQIASRISEEAKTRLTNQATADKVTLSELISDILENADNSPKMGEIQKNLQYYITQNNAIENQFDSFVVIMCQYVLKKDFGNRIDNIDAIAKKINDDKLRKEATAQKRAKK